MKPTTSALKHFILGAAVTAVASSKFVFGIQSDSRSEEQQQQHEVDGRLELQPPLSYDIGHEKQLQSDRFDHRSIEGKRYIHSNNNHHRFDPDGVLISSPSLVSKSREKFSPCSPDIGALACPRKGESCANVLLLSSSKGEPDEDWRCVPRRPLSLGVGALGDAVAIDQANQTTALHRSLMIDEWDGFPPSGEVYDECTYDLGYEYDFNSTIAFPSGWDRCACEGYDYSLPTSTYIYTDVEYCFKVNKYYCANYYNNENERSPNSYDACLCSTYGNKPIPDEDSNFCFELPKRYCEAYYPNLDLIGVAKCLCDSFGYDDFCDFEPPPGFQPVTQPTPIPPTNSPTGTTPTAKPTNEPTREPTVPPTANPSQKPTPSPTREPTVSPTSNPTRKPTRKPTRDPTAPPTREPTPQPTGEPTKFKPTKRPTPNPTVATEAPTSKPTQRPRKKKNRKKPTKKPTKTPFTPLPTPEPTPLPTPEPTPKPTPTPLPTPKPTKKAPAPTPGPTPPSTAAPVRKLPPLTLPPTPEPTTEPTKKSPPPTPEPTNKPPPPTISPVKEIEKNKETRTHINPDYSIGSNDEPPVVHNIDKLPSIITTLRRQPSIYQRPGSSLRLPEDNLFERDRNNN